MIARSSYANRVPMPITSTVTRLPDTAMLKSTHYHEGPRFDLAQMAAVKLHRATLREVFS